MIFSSPSIFSRLVFFILTPSCMLQLAVQAATGGSRPSSLSALMHLHRELSFEPSTFNARLVRVVTKLFTRVIKAEDAEQNPWESSDIDSILVSLDDHFHACNQAEESGDAPDADAIVACRNMAKSLVESVMKAVGGAAAIRDRMESFEMETLDLAKIVSKFDIDEPADAGEGLSRQEGSPSKPSKDVAALVSALGSAQTETERETALSNLRHYQLQHGEQDLNMYLEQVSPAFRQYILDQLNQHEKSSHESNMSERLRLLRSRLHSSSDAQGNVSAASSASSPAPKVQSRLSAPSPSKVTHDSSSTSIGAYEVPAPHIAAPSASSSVSSASRSEFSASQSLRERLAAAQENRAKSAVVPSDNSSTSGSRAAALRARLQAVKQQAMQHQ